MGLRAEELYEFRAAVLIKDIHVVTIFNDDNGGFRLYDNDSRARREGTYEAVRCDELLDRFSEGVTTGTPPYLIGILDEGCDLSQRLGPPLTTLVHRERRARETTAAGGGDRPARRQRAEAPRARCARGTTESDGEAARPIRQPDGLTGGLPKHLSDSLLAPTVGPTIHVSP